MAFVNIFSIDDLGCNGILSTDVMYKFLVRVLKYGIFFTKNMSKYSVTCLCIFLIVSGTFMMSILTCRGCCVCSFTLHRFDYRTVYTL